MTPITLEYPTGSTDLYVYYVGRTLANYVADKVLFVERSAPNLGLYDATIDESKGTSLRLFVGAAQPASWADAVIGVGWDLLLAEFKADAQLGTASGGMVANAAQVLNIGRSANPLEAGAATTETRRVVIDTREALTETRTIS